MTANLKTQELIDAVITLLKAASFTFTPLLWQDGKLGHYAAGVNTSDLPAVFVHEEDPLILDIGGAEQGLADIGGGLVAHITDLRIVLVKQWDDDDVMPTQRRSEIQEIAQEFIGSSSYGYDLGASIAGLEMIYAIPTQIEFEPPEQEQIPSLDHTYAAAVTLRIRTQSARS